MCEETVIGGFAKETVPWLLKNLPALSTRIAKIRDFIFSKNKKNKIILIAGSGGVGKTTIGQLLSGIDPSGDYKESISTEEFTYQQEPTVQVTVLPGQEHRRSSTWPEFETEVRNGSIRGIILVNAWGYHSLGNITFTEHRLHDEEKSKESFLLSYLEERREEEVRIVERISKVVKDSPRKFWLINVITKEDLWWGEKQKVTSHYEKGQYFEAYKSIFSFKDNRHFRTETVAVCSIINNFKTGFNELLAENTAGYTHVQQLASINRLLDVIESLSNWENSK